MRKRRMRISLIRRMPHPHSHSSTLLGLMSLALLSPHLVQPSPISWDREDCQDCPRESPSTWRKHLHPRERLPGDQNPLSSACHPMGQPSLSPSSRWLLLAPHPSLSFNSQREASLELRLVIARDSAPCWGPLPSALLVLLDRRRLKRGATQKKRCLLTRLEL